MNRFAGGGGGEKRAGLQDGGEGEAVGGHATTVHLEIQEEGAAGEARADEAPQHAVVGEAGGDGGVGEEEGGEAEVAVGGRGREGEEGGEGGRVPGGSGDDDPCEVLLEVGHGEAAGRLGEPM